MKKIFTILILLASITLCNAQGQTASTSQAQAKYFPTAYYHKKGYVISPYKPYNIVDVRHLNAGDLAYDPSSIKKNPTTGKNDLQNANIFRVPQNISRTIKPVTKPVPAASL